MEFIFNGQKETLAEEKTIGAFLKDLGMSPEIVTISYNGKVVAKDQINEIILKDGDSLDVLMFMGGGQ